jgi:hypothetical protein
MLVIAGLQNHQHEHTTSAGSFCFGNVLILEVEDQQGQKNFTDNAPPEKVNIFLYPYMGANFGKLPTQITKFLNSKSYHVMVAGVIMPITGTPIVQGYEVKGYNKNEIHITIGSF